MSKPKKKTDPHEGLTLLKANHRDYPADPALAARLAGGAEVPDDALAAVADLLAACGVRA